MARTIPPGTKVGGIMSGTAALNYFTVICPSGASAAVDSNKISNNPGVFQGKIVGFKAKANNCTNNITFTSGVKDRDGDTIFSVAGLLRNAVNFTNTMVVGGVTVPLAIPVYEQEKITITPSGDPGASTLIINVTIYYDPDVDQIRGW